MTASTLIAAHHTLAAEQRAKCIRRHIFLSVPCLSNDIILTFVSFHSLAPLCLAYSANVLCSLCVTNLVRKKEIFEIQNITENSIAENVSNNGS